MSSRKKDFKQTTLICRKRFRGGGYPGLEGPARVVGDPLPLRLHDGLPLPPGAQQVSRGQALGESRCWYIYLGVEPRHPVSREDMDRRKSAGSDVAGY